MALARPRPLVSCKTSNGGRAQRHVGCWRHIPCSGGGTVASLGTAQQLPVIAQSQGSDAASVVFDAVQAAQARNVDVLLVDTAGRLQAKTQLMMNWRRSRVVQRLDPDAPHEVILVLDGGGPKRVESGRTFP
ncbi:MAG: hypothetical protein CM15mP120_07710 [Pseudomonadota bacterium]|nr:MAG: hypothetical protein CM15mP120_07710 [Pseudomonadota bacterium]